MVPRIIVVTRHNIDDVAEINGWDPEDLRQEFQEVASRGRYLYVKLED